MATTEVTRRIEELELRYKIASGLVLTWGNYNSRQHLEDEIDKIAATLNREKAE